MQNDRCGQLPGGAVTLQRVEVGLVSADEALVEFVAAVFELERLPAVRSGSGVVHRLEAPGAQIKVMVPSRRPASAEPVGVASPG